jgi:hypothetical protein
MSTELKLGSPARPIRELPYSCSTYSKHEAGNRKFDSAVLLGYRSEAISNNRTLVAYAAVYCPINSVTCVGTGVLQLISGRLFGR